MQIRAIIILLLLAACATIPAAELRSTAVGIAAKYNMKEKVYETSTFKIFALGRITDPALPVRFYIEGDGNSWRTPNMPSENPTPIRSVMLELATIDNSPNVVYLARPCQYVEDAKCEEKFWTSGIYSPKAVTAINEVIKTFPAQAELVGYSGGAAIAILIAAENPNVISLRSVAGNLDQKKFVEVHNLDPLTDSADMDPAIPKLARLPQIHFVGGDDDIVPPAIAESYQQKLGLQNCSQVQIIPGNNHVKGWYEIWPELLKQIPACQYVATK